MVNKFFPEVNNTLGFGCMRLPMKDNEVDYEEMNRMVDLFIEQGFNYFDTAHGYLNGKSETAIRDCISARYPRDKFILTNKLTDNYFKKQEDIRPFFEMQLKACGVDYFDFYLMHAQCADNYQQYKECRAYETVQELKAEGKIRHMGISFHDRASVLEQILQENPQIEVVQIQFNYLDYEDEAVESRKCYEVCVKYQKPVIVMEPVKGGSLHRLPREAKDVFDRLGGKHSYASYAVRFAAGFDQMMMVLSGMSDMPQMQDNLDVMRDFEPLNEVEMAAVDEVRKIYKNMATIPCTACKYCVAGCPQKISIPDLFACMNSKILFDDFTQVWYYEEVYTKNGGKASDCIKCGKCEKACPQHLEIRKLLEDVAKVFEKKEGAEQ